MLQTAVELLVGFCSARPLSHLSIMALYIDLTLASGRISVMNLSLGNCQCMALENLSALLADSSKSILLDSMCGF